MQPFEQEQRDQGRPNLGAKRVFAGAHEELFTVKFWKAWRRKS